MLRVRLGLLGLALAMAAASVVVLVRNRSVDDELLAAIGLAGAIALAVITLIIDTTREKSDA